MTINVGQMRSRGALITFEGVEGSGKSTQARRLAGTLEARGLGVSLTSEPDGTPLGVAIRAMLELDGPRRTPLAEALLFMAARQQHVAQVIRPALERGHVVISDRYVDATVAYQGHGRGLDVRAIEELNLIATGGVLPDLTLVLDVPVEVGMTRIAGRAHDSFERLGIEFHARVRQGYLEIAAADKARVALIDAAQPEDEVERAVWRAVAERLGESLRGA
jgi:dTMP kinase